MWAGVEGVKVGGETGVRDEVEGGIVDEVKGEEECAESEGIEEGG